LEKPEFISPLGFHTARLSGGTGGFATGFAKHEWPCCQGGSDGDCALPTHEPGPGSPAKPMGRPTVVKRVAHEPEFRLTPSLVGSRLCLCHHSAKSMTTGRLIGACVLINRAIPKRLPVGIRNSLSRRFSPRRDHREKNPTNRKSCTSPYCDDSTKQQSANR